MPTVHGTDDALVEMLRLCARLPGHARLDQVRGAASQVPWQEFPSAADAHGLAPLARVHLSEAGVSTEVEVQQHLTGLAMHHRSANAIRFTILGEILEAFEAASIRVLVLKGAALAHILYPSPSLRPLSDIDLLVAPDQAGKAQATLASLGFAAAQRPTGRRFVGHHHLPPAFMIRDCLFVQVEIHTDAMSRDTPGSLTLDGSYDRRQAFTVGGRTAYALGHLEMLHHLARHTAERASLLRLIWVTDVVAYATRFRTEIDWPEVRRHYPFVLNALSLLHLVTPLPAELLDEVPRQRPGLVGAGVAYRPLSEIVRSHRPVGAIVRELFGPNEWWVRFYYGAVSTSSYLRYVLIVHPVRVAWWFARRAVAWLQWNHMVKPGNGD